MPVKRFLDTNILLYAYDLDAGEKREVALRRVEEAFSHPESFRGSKEKVYNTVTTTAHNS